MDSSYQISSVILLQFVSSQLDIDSKVTIIWEFPIRNANL